MLKPFYNVLKMLEKIDKGKLFIKNIFPKVAEA